MVMNPSNPSDRLNFPCPPIIGCKSKVDRNSGKNAF
jgi:hypothetical protein